LIATSFGRIAVSFKPYDRSFCSGADVIAVQCARVDLTAVKNLLWPSHWSQVEVQVDGLEDIDWCPEIEMLGFAAKGLKGVARLAQDPVEQIRVWKRAKGFLERLMDRGWNIHAGAAADVLVIVLTKRDVANLDANVEWESDPDLRACRVIDDWWDGLHLS
jgi:hypothetical protein